MSTPGQVRGGSGGWPTLVRCDIGRSWRIGIDSHLPGIRAVRDGEPITAMVIAQIAQAMVGQSVAATQLRSAHWVDARVLLADIATETDRLTAAIATHGDLTRSDVTRSQTITALHVLAAWVLTLAGGAVDDLPPGQTRSPFAWRYTATGLPVTLPAPVTQVHTRAGARGVVMDAWIDLATQQAVTAIDTDAGPVHDSEPVTTRTIEVHLPADPTIGRVHHRTTADQMRQELSVVLDEAAPGVRVDIDAVVADLIRAHGPIHPDLVPENEFWRVVITHAHDAC